ncbi:MAG: zinc ribbon domain-containing protein [Phycisphaerales bacterium]|nr:zinc ribbon domain-containing protein [Phycisphaerales bacterium]
MTSIATHWPRLTFGAEGPSDKAVHALAFGVIAYLVVQARWIRGLWATGLAMSGYALLDESTQQLPWFNRHTSIEDYFADIIGIATACMMVWPLPMPATRLAKLRQGLSDAARRRLLDRPAAWLAFVTTGVLGAMIGGAIGLLFRNLAFDRVRIGQAILAGTVIGVGIAIALACRPALAAHSRAIRGGRLCFKCGNAIALGADAREGACLGCGALWRRVQWILPADTDESGRSISTRLARTVLAMSNARAVVMVIAAGAIVVVSSWAMAFSDILVMPSSDLRALAVAAVWVAAIAVAERSIRLAKQSRRDGEGNRCLACGHDLHASMVGDDRGCCPECGAEFARIDAAAQG